MTEKKSIAARLRHVASEKPNHAVLAFWSEGLVKTRSYTELFDYSSRLASLLVRELAPRSRVGIYCDKTFHSYAALLACLDARMTFVPLNPKLPDDRMKTILSVTDIQLVLSEFPIQDSHCKVLGLNEKILDEVRLPAPLKWDKEDDVYVLFTSGSTGVPKGVPINYENLSAYLEAFRIFLNPGENERVSQTHDLSFDLAIGDILVGLLSGATLCPLGTENLYALDDYLRRLQISTLTCVPSLIKLARDLGHARPAAFPGLTKTIFCGERLPTDLAHFWREAAPNSQIGNAYGPTETTVNAVAHWWNSSSTEVGATIPIGKGLAGVKTILVDGELLISGPQVSRGYLNDERETAKVFVTIEDDQFKNRWYRTGDLAAHDAEGNLVFLGRKDWQLKIRGRRIELEELESVLSHLLSGADVVFLPKDLDAYGDPISLLAVVGGSGSYTPATLATALQAMRSKVDSIFLPERVYQISSMPLTQHGKVDRNQIQDMDRTDWREIK